MLFLQGERDQLADLALLRPICARLGERATLHVVPAADHGFHVLKRAGRSDAEVIAELAASSPPGRPALELNPAREPAGLARSASIPYRVSCCEELERNLAVGACRKP